MMILGMVVFAILVMVCAARLAERLPVKRVDRSEHRFHVGGFEPGVGLRTVPEWAQPRPVVDVRWNGRRSGVGQVIAVGAAMAAAPAVGSLLMPGHRSVLGTVAMTEALQNPTSTWGGYVLASDSETPTGMVHLVSAFEDTLRPFDELG